MRYLEQASVNTIILGHFFANAQKGDGEIFDGFVAAPFSKHLSPARVKIALETLCASNFLKRVPNPGGGATYSLTTKGYEKAEEFYLSGDESIVKILFDRGVETLFDLLSSENLSINHEIPASDRVVTKDDNKPAAAEALEALNALVSELDSGSNEVGALLGDERDLARQEVVQLQEMVTKERFRPAPALTWAKKVLGWLAEKAGGAGVGDLAKRALDALFNWLS